MEFFDRNRTGADGASHEFEAITKMGRLKPTKIQGKPVNLSATGRCAECGTSDQLTGRPGTKITRANRCRSCGQGGGAVNGGLGYTFPSPN